jgi:hypothetical protein
MTNTPVFNFTVKPQTNSTRPSFNAMILSTRALDTASDDITVTSSDPSFAVIQSSDYYTLVINKSYVLNINNSINIYIHRFDLVL